MKDFAEGVRVAEGLGHAIKNDPPHSLSNMSRATCERCGRSVLGNNAVAYGSATDGECPRKEP